MPVALSWSLVWRHFATRQVCALLNNLIDSFDLIFIKPVVYFRPIIGSLSPPRVHFISSGAAGDVRYLAGVLTRIEDYNHELLVESQSLSEETLQSRAMLRPNVVYTSNKGLHADQYNCAVTGWVERGLILGYLLDVEATLRQYERHSLSTQMTTETVDSPPGRVVEII
jgi:hypothetical protein